MEITDERAFNAWYESLPIKPFPYHVAYKAFVAGRQSRAILALERDAAGAAVSPDARTDLEWFRLPEIFAKFVDYAERPIDANALRIIQAVTERQPATGVRSSSAERDAALPVVPAMIEAEDASRLSDDLENLRRAHWSHWTAQENHIAAVAVRHLRLLAAAPSQPGNAQQENSND